MKSWRSATLLCTVKRPTPKKASEVDSGAAALSGA